MDYKVFSHNLAREAGMIMKRYFLNSSTEWKEDNSPVTIADRKINQLVIDRVMHYYPTHGVLGEEDSYLPFADMIWVCDPIDGTTPYAHGTPTSVFSLALVEFGKPIVAIIYDPWLDRTYFAEFGSGTTLNGKPVSVNENDSLHKSVISVAKWRGSEFDLSSIPYGLNIGSIVYASMLVASGEFSGTFYAGTHAHDAAAVKLIVEEAGGKVTDLFGKKQLYNGKINGFIASNKRLHSKLLDLVPKGL